tara:strand:- start:281 stop:472 length:192 start_codon:yes stop_codon:yes gene_type:complete
MTYVEKTFTEDMGGGCMIDFLILTDGRCVGIDSDSIVLYKSYEQARDGVGFEKMIDLWEGAKQ